MQNHCDCSCHGLGCAASSFLFPIFPVCLVVSLALSLTGDSYLSHSPVKPCCIYTKLYCLFPSRALIACQPGCSTLANFISFGDICVLYTCAEIHWLSVFSASVFALLYPVCQPSARLTPHLISTLKKFSKPLNSTFQ